MRSRASQMQEFQAPGYEEGDHPYRCVGQMVEMLATLRVATTCVYLDVPGTRSACF
jgi:hypothetical protein